jgi:hypothetical protein
VPIAVASNPAADITLTGILFFHYATYVPLVVNVCITYPPDIETEPPVALAAVPR